MLQLEVDGGPSGIGGTVASFLMTKGLKSIKVLLSILLRLEKSNKAKIYGY